MNRSPTPTLLPILRSQQQGEILALLLGDPDRELSLTEADAGRQVASGLRPWWQMLPS
jgi:hypothetical protein